MREILFRGKNKYCNEPYKKGDWLYGDLVKLKDGDMIHSYIYGGGEIDPETVGQYTSLTDKKDKKIFEGDIVSHKGQLYEIKYSTKHARFLAFLIGGDGIFNPAAMQNCEIIGNIHDDPELLAYPQQ
ncbi:MAG: YopX family protein [Ruminococcus sp.]|nr:YopX family protein [Ruminococcus sp.]